MIEQPLGMPHRAVGVDDLAAVELAEGGDKRSIRRHAGEVDLVHKGEKVMRVDVVDLHQPVHRRAVLAEISAPQLGRPLRRNRETDADVLVHPVLHLIEQAAGGRVQRVVEIEDPGFDLAERAPLLPGGVSHRPPEPQPPRIRVPAPSVNNSSRIACGTRPSTITAASTPPSTAARQVSTLGIMPPEIVPCAISRRASAAVSSGIRRLSPSSTPATAGSSMKRRALTAAATAPATVSALML